MKKSSNRRSPIGRARRRSDAEPSTGFEPVRTWSSHRLRHPLFADAVERYLARESGGIEAYIDELNERTALLLRQEATR